MTTTQLYTPPSVASTAARFSESDDRSPYRAHWIPEKANYSQTDNALTDVAARHIKAFGVSVFLMIQRHADFETGESCPTIEMLMEKLDVSEPTAIKYVALLEQCKMITKRQSKWGNREQGPKSRNFYRVLPSTLWDFSGLKNKIKAAPKQNKPDLKEIKPYNKHVSAEKHESQETSYKVQEAKTDVVSVISSASEEEVCPIVEQLLAKGVRPDEAANLAFQVPDICRDALGQLSRARKAKPNPGGWLVTVIKRQRDAQGIAPPGFAPSEADAVNQRPKEKEKPAEPVAPELRELVAQSEEERQQLRDMACDEVFQSLPPSEQDRIHEEARPQVSSAARQNPSRPAAKLEWLNKEREIVARYFGVRVESVIRSRRHH